MRDPALLDPPAPRRVAGELPAPDTAIVDIVLLAKIELDRTIAFDNVDLICCGLWEAVSEAAINPLR